MLTYIESLKNKLENTTCEKEKESIYKLLIQEKDSCRKILEEYESREVRAWVKCEQICTHENEMIKRIDEILFKEEKWK